MKRLVSGSIFLGIFCTFTSLSDASITRFDVVPAYAPNGPTASPSWGGWMDNAILNLRMLPDSGTVRGAPDYDPTAYETIPTDPSMPIQPSEIIVTTDPSWRGGADDTVGWDGPGNQFADENGNRAYFGFALETNGNFKLSVADLNIEWTKHWMNNDEAMETSSIIQDPLTTGAFGDRSYTDALVGVEYGADGEPDWMSGNSDDILHTSGNAAVDAIYYVGVGDGLEPENVDGATTQEEIDLFVNDLLAADHPAQKRKTSYTITLDSNEQLIGMNTIFLVPEPASLTTMITGLGCFVFIKRRRR